MDDVYLISLAKTEYREGYNNADVERVLSVFAEAFTNMSDGDCSFFGEEGKPALREQLDTLFDAYRVQMFPIIIDIVPKGGAAVDWGWHKVVLEPKDGGEVQRLKLRLRDLGSAARRHLENRFPDDQSRAHPKNVRRIAEPRKFGCALSKMDEGSLLLPVMFLESAAHAIAEASR
jgi:hypothetical protein